VSAPRVKQKDLQRLWKTKRAVEKVRWGPRKRAHDKASKRAASRQNSYTPARKTQGHPLQHGDRIVPKARHPDVSAVKGDAKGLSAHGKGAQDSAYVRV